MKRGNRESGHNSDVEDPGYWSSASGNQPPSLLVVPDNDGQRLPLISLPRPAGVIKQPNAPTADAATRTRRRFLQLLALSLFLIAWVVNGEMLQAIYTGGFSDIPAYDKPFAMTWLSYNYMLFGLVVVLPLHAKGSFQKYVLHVWPGRLKFSRAMAICAAQTLMLQFLNVLFVVGLACLPISVSNAVYQLQTVFTVGLSVWCLNDRLVLVEGVGILLSIIGVGCIVLPPLLESNDTHEENDTARCSRNSMLWGALASLLSSALGGAYLVAFRAFDEARYGTASTRVGVEGLVDTHMTLVMMGFCNLTLCWILLPLTHWTGLEPMELPPSWWMLHWNGVIEYAFIASCAVAIYMTTPVVVAIVSPLTIPAVSFADYFLLGKSTGSSNLLAEAVGVVVILIGIGLMETKPDLNQWCPLQPNDNLRRRNNNNKTTPRRHKSLPIEALRAADNATNKEQEMSLLSPGDLVTCIGEKQQV
jgi:drug/metabolite transporter (DMT)-like permease